MLVVGECLQTQRDLFPFVIKQTESYLKVKHNWKKFRSLYYSQRISPAFLELLKTKFSLRIVFREGIIKYFLSMFSNPHVRQKRRGIMHQRDSSLISHFQVRFIQIYVFLAICHIIGSSFLISSKTEFFILLGQTIQHIIRRYLFIKTYNFCAMLFDIILISLILIIISVQPSYILILKKKLVLMSYFNFFGSS